MTLGQARRWVWARLVRRRGATSHATLHAAWDRAPGLLDDALRSLRDDGMLQCISGRWYIREWQASARLPDPIGG